MSAPLLTETDKFFWHDYIPFYESFFKNIQPKQILEMGLANGHSIRYLLNRFPDAKITGVDIIERIPEWPVDPRFTAEQLDQGNVPQVQKFFENKKFDLIIEDGSHHPVHQVTCLLNGLRTINSGGIFILEDIHTSHPLDPFYVSRAPLKRFFNKFKKFPKGNALSTLLAIGHYKRINQDIDHRRASLIAEDSLINKEEVLELSKKIKNIHLYRRSHLPDKCICGAVDYNYSTYRCVCGNPVFSDRDSMSFVIECN